MISRIFSSKFLAYSLDIRFRSFHALHIQNLSNRCRHKFNQSISRIFLNLIFGGFFFLSSPTVPRPQCSCDKLCPVFRDCCKDYSDVCDHDPLPSFIYNHGHFKCLKTNSQPEHASTFDWVSSILHST